MSMQNKLVWAAMLCTAIGVSQGAAAQTFEPMANNIPIGAPISLEKAQKVIAVAQAEAKKRNWAMAIIVDEPTGSMLAFAKMDGTQYASIDVVQAKARTAATFRRPSAAFAAALAAGHTGVLLVPGVIASPGGIPLMHDGKIVGAIGVSGGSDAQDTVIAQLAADSFK